MVFVDRPGLSQSPRNASTSARTLSSIRPDPSVRAEPGEIYDREMSVKIDLKKICPSYRAKRGVVDIIEVPTMRYLTVTGHGDPNTEQGYQEAVEALYTVAYKIKFASKRELERDYVVPPLEGLWWADDMDAFTGRLDKSQWTWTMMILVPEWVSDSMVAHVIAAVGESKTPPPRLMDVNLDRLDEGLCVQTLHVGSFDDEGPVLDAIHHDVIPRHGLIMTGKHHEIYLSDPRRTAPERLRTILRQPVAHALS